MHAWVIQSGPHAGETHNMVYIATSNNNVYAYAEDHLLSGSTSPFWGPVTLGPPVNRTGSNIPPPIGIAATPVLDPPNARLFVCSYQDGGANNSIYRMFALDMDTGTVLQNAVLSDRGAAGRPRFDANLQDQRGALNLVNGRVHATFADFLAYDTGQYHGWLVSCNANNLSKQWYFSATKNVLGGGIWGPGGVAAAPDGTLYVATGNSPTANNNYWTAIVPPGQHPGDIGDYFMGVVKLVFQTVGFTGSLAVLGWYQPTDARPLNDADLDFGSSSCLVLPDSPNFGGMHLLVLAAKNAIYLLSRDKLQDPAAHWGGELWTNHVFNSESHSAPAYYKTPAGRDYVYFSGGGLPGLICYQVAAGGGAGSLQEVWRAGGHGVAFHDACGSPTIGSATSPNPFALVWVADAPDPPNSGILRAYNALDGREVYNSAAVAADDLGPVPHYPPVTCAGQSVYVGTNNGFALYQAAVSLGNMSVAVTTLHRTAGSITIQVSVTDAQSHTPITGANIEISDPELGNIKARGATGGDGKVTLTYRRCRVSSNGPPFRTGACDGTASKPGYNDADITLPL
jgi:hypothetical protein